ncbi:T6SS phospholipase effector Tle1-like catalytic domain-containing protein [Pseudomonas putida]|uniref:T6SS phospholipase effector Tle1-like catalytic domain-containing protein n=1 Tax=Pseudomonas putida TaxID=303 RepID=UPI003D66492D
MMMSKQSAVPAPVTLRVGVFFDGTGNNQGNAAPLAATGHGCAGGSYANARSNIALLHALYPCGPVHGQVHFNVYVEGIGTTHGGPDSPFAQATGRGSAGVAARVEQALAEVGRQLRDYRAKHPQFVPTCIEFDLFGFSRGAAAARHLANRLGTDETGLPAELHGPRAINFIGLFDTVAAIVAPLQGSFGPASDRHGGLRLGLDTRVARQVVQLVAGDEQRHNFPLVLSDNDIVVPGVHSNIGGGYLEHMHEQVLLCKPHSSRVARTTPAHCTRAHAAVTGLLSSTFASLVDPRPRLLSWEVPVQGSRARRDEPEKQVYAAVYREREVSGHLSRVYLSIMRELAVRGGVAFAPLGGDEAHRLPAELLPVSRKLHEFALGQCAQLHLTPQERALLQAKYVHTSAHWNAVKGLDNSSLDALFIDRPGKAGRVLHRNPVG